MKTDEELIHKIKLIVFSALELSNKKPEQYESYKSAGFDHIVDVLMDKNSNEEKDND